MHGYFTLVRMRALKTMNRAHSVMRKSASFPLSAVAKMLAFQNDRKVSITCIEIEIVEWTVAVLEVPQTQKSLVAILEILSTVIV